MGNEQSSPKGGGGNGWEEFAGCCQNRKNPSDSRMQRTAVSGPLPTTTASSGVVSSWDQAAPAPGSDNPKVKLPLPPPAKERTKLGSSAPSDASSSNIASHLKLMKNEPSSPQNVPPPGPASDKVGIGAYFHKSSEDPDYLCVKSLIDGPAKRCGKIRTGDCIVSIDGKDVHGRRLAELADHLLGPRGSDVTLKFKNSGGESYEVTIKRGT